MHVAASKVLDRFLGRSTKVAAATADLDENRTDVILKSEFGDDITVQNSVNYSLEHKEVTLKIEVTFPEEQDTTDDIVLRLRSAAQKIFGEGSTVAINHPKFQFFSIERNFIGA